MCLCYVCYYLLLRNVTVVRAVVVVSYISFGQTYGWLGGSLADGGGSSGG